MIGWMRAALVTTALAVGLTAYACCGAARAGTLPETCPAALVNPAPRVATTHVGVAIAAASARTVSGGLTIRTDHGWFTTTFPAQKLQLATVHLVNGLKVVRTVRDYLSPVLYIDFPQPVTIVSMWISNARATEDTIGWTAQGSVSCDPPQHDPLQWPPSPSPSPKFVETFAPADLAPFVAPPSPRAIHLVLRPMTPLDTSCPHPFTDATVVHAARPQYPFTKPMQQGTSMIEVLIGHDGSALAASVMYTSGLQAFDDAAMRAAESSTYTPATAYCKPVLSRYLFRASFNPR